MHCEAQSATAVELKTTIWTNTSWGGGAAQILVKQCKKTQSNLYCIYCISLLRTDKHAQSLNTPFPSCSPPPPFALFCKFQIRPSAHSIALPCAQNAWISVLYSKDQLQKSVVHFLNTRLTIIVETENSSIRGSQLDTTCITGSIAHRAAKDGGFRSSTVDFLH